MNKVLFGVAFLGLASCGPGTPLGPSIDEADALRQIQAALATRSYSTAYTSLYGGANLCTKDFPIQSVIVTDKSITGKIAKVSVTINATNSTKETVDSSYYNAGCFGVPRSGWAPGQLVSDNEVFTFTLWDSGWKIDPQPNR